MFLFLLRSICMFLPICYLGWLFIYCLMFWGSLHTLSDVYLVKLISHSVGNHSVNSLLCRNFKKLLCVCSHVCGCTGICAHVYTCTCRYRWRKVRSTPLSCISCTRDIYLKVRTKSISEPLVVCWAVMGMLQATALENRNTKIFFLVPEKLENNYMKWSPWKQSAKQP